jgi:hypothetical protein
MRLSIFALITGISLFILGTGTASASIVSGTIDTHNHNWYIVHLLDDTGLPANLDINFGKFTTQSSANITVDDDGLHGFAWGSLAGWIVMNCKDTTSGCSATNDNFKVAISSTGLLSGYAWGENTGWINFGPFTDTSISRVQIKSDGRFQGNLGDAGYAWSENLGWITFDCSAFYSCVETDYRPSSVRPQCSNNIDDDGDGDIDLQDAGCTDIHDDTEKILPVTAAVGTNMQCSNGKDDDGDGFTDFPFDPNCTSRQDNSESPDPVFFPKPIIPGILTPPGYPPTRPPTYPPRTPGSSVPFTPVSNEPAPWVFVPGTIPPPIQGVIPPPRHGLTMPARDTVLEAIQGALQKLKVLIQQTVEQIAVWMQGLAGESLAGTLAVLGLIIFTAVAAFIAFSAPISTIAQSLTLPYFLFHTLVLLFGIQKKAPRWGTVVNSRNNTPVAFTQIHLWNTEGSIVAVTKTTADGSFSFIAPPGTYTLTVSQGASQLPFVPTNAPLGTLYQGGQFTTTAPAPNEPLVVGVFAPTYTPISNRELWVMRHEVLMTHIALAFFGAGALMALLYCIFYPSLTSLTILLLYGFVVTLRSFGVLGSYGSIFTSKENNTPLVGKAVTAIDITSQKEVAKTLTSRLGRAYLSLPRGHYALRVSVAEPGVPGGETTISPVVVTQGGLYRRRFRL